MFIINDDMSIYATRGDIVFFTVTAENDDGIAYEFQPGDVVRMKIFGKKDAENVVMQKDFPVSVAKEYVEIFLNGEDTKIGEVISKATDYWYEVELNPDTNPQTIIGYDDDGAKVFKLYPEGMDIPEKETDPEEIPVVDAELDMTSPRPVQNRAIARAVVNIEGNLRKIEAQARADKKAAADAVTDLAYDLAVERARMDNFVSGATANDAEVVDVRVGADGVIYESAGTAVREQLKNLKGFALAGGKRNSKLVGVDAVYESEDGYYNTDKTFAASEYYKTALFECRCGDIFTVHNTQVGAAALRAFLLDENKSVIYVYEFGEGYVQDVYYDNEYAVAHTNARYLGISVYHQALEFGAQKYAAASDELSKSVEEIEAAVFDVEDTPVEVAVYGNYYIDVNGELVENSIYFCSELFEVNPGEKYHAKSSNLGTAAYAYALYNKDGELCGIGNRGTGSTDYASEDYYVTIPENAAFIRFGWHEPSNSFALYKVEKVGIFSAVHNDNPLHGKVLIGLGDSLMCDVYTGAGKEWLSIIGRRNGMEVYNYAKSGNPISVQADCMAVRYADMVDADEPYVIVMGGANDRNISAPIGSNGDGSIETFKGALNVLIRGLIAKYPKGRIVFCTNYKRYGGADEKAYVDAMLEICERHCIPCHNNYASSGCHFDNEGWMKIFGADAENFGNKHLNALGDERVSTMYEALLRAL